MKKLGLSAAVLAMSVVMVAADADAATKKRKAGFFASLFGGVSEQKPRERKRKSVFGNKWWQEDDSGSDVRVIRNPEGDVTRKKRKKLNAITADSEPDADPGLGMGNLTFVPERLVALGGAILITPRPSMGPEADIYDALSDKDLGIRLRTAERDAIVAQYAGRDYKPLWLENGKLTPRGEALLQQLSKVGEDGFTPADYLPPALTSFDAAAQTLDPATAARLDVGLTAKALSLAHDMSGGKFDPQRLSLYHDLQPSWVDAAKALNVLAFSPYPVEYLASLRPTHPAYAQLRTALAEAQATGAAPAPEPIPDGKIIKLGRSDDRLPEIRARLEQRGYAAPADYLPDDPMVLDKELSARLKTFQKDAGIKVSGLVGPQTIGALNGDVSSRNISKLINSMERLRWLPRELGPRHVFVNQAAFEVDVMNRGSVEWHSKVIVGRPMTQTAVFKDEIETVVFNPSWGVPQSIIANEYLPKLRNDPGYLDRIGFKVVNAQGKVVRSSSVDWWSYGSKVPYGIQQPPGEDNALGELKFLFPNSHDIYMHDTPSRHLFANDVRAFSHGCVRVENPRDFATVLLGWDADKVADAIASGKSQSVKLESKVPVYLTYFTAWPGKDGKIVYHNDVYGRDDAMDKARSALTVAQR